MIQKRVLEEFDGVIKVFKNNEIEDRTILSFIDTNFDFLKEKEDIERHLFLLMNKKELYSVLYVNEDNYLWSTFDDKEFMPFRKLSDDFKKNDYVVEMVIAYASSYKIKEAIPEIDDMNVENKVKTLKNIGLNSNGYHIK